MAKYNAWMPLFIGDLIADTTHLSRADFGSYMLLVCLYWRRREPLPDDDRALSTAARATLDEWKLSRPVLAEFFQITNGLWRHKRIDEELEISRKRYEGNLRGAIQTNNARRKAAATLSDAASAPVGGVQSQSQSPIIYKDKTGSEGDQGSNSTDPPSGQSVGSKRLHGIPGSVEEVIAYGQSINPRIHEAQCCAFWAHYEGQARTNESGEIFWITSGDAVVTNWKVKLPQFQTLHESNRTPDKRGAAQRPDRNAGTCNEGNHTKYGNLGRVAGAGNVR